MTGINNPEDILKIKPEMKADEVATLILGEEEFQYENNGIPIPNLQEKAGEWAGLIDEARARMRQWAKEDGADPRLLERFREVDKLIGDTYRAFLLVRITPTVLL